MPEPLAVLVVGGSARRGSPEGRARGGRPTGRAARTRTHEQEDGRDPEERHRLSCGFPVRRMRRSRLPPRPDRPTTGEGGLPPPSLHPWLDPTPPTRARLAHL